MTPSGDPDQRGRPTPESWLRLEWLAWFIGDQARAGHRVSITAEARPPWVNFPGHMLRFWIEGERTGPGAVEADDVASALVRLYSEFGPS